MTRPRARAEAETALREQRALRWVGCARLHGTAAEAAPRLRFALEDALNGADFQDGGRLVLLRRLRLGRLPAGLPGHAMARALERAWREQAHQAVHAAQPACANAPAVWFHDAGEVRLLALRQLLQGHALTAWYWPLALPVVAQEPAAAAMRTLAAQLARQAPRRLQALLGMAAVPALRRLLDALPAQPDPDFVLRSPRIPRPRAEPGSQPRVAPPLKPAPAPQAATAMASGPAARAAGWDMAIQLWQARLGDPPIATDDWRLQWLAERAAAPAATAMQTAVLPASPGADAAPVSESAMAGRTSNAPEPTAIALRIASPAQTPPTAASFETARPSAPAAVRRLQAPRARSPATRPSRAFVPAGLPAWQSAAQPSDWAGFLFLLNLLHALGFERWLATQPQHSAAALLVLLAGRLRLALDDPHRTLWAAEAAAATPALRAWAWQLRRSLRRAAGLGIARLARRSGALVISDTHVDVLLPLDAVDLRIRRLGLDADPGWMPWFGRIVSFHYLGDDAYGAGSWTI